MQSVATTALAVAAPALNVPEPSHAIPVSARLGGRGIDDPLADPTADLPLRDRRLRILRRYLGPVDAQVIDLIALGNLTHRQAAEAMKLSPSIVSRRVERIRAILRSPTLAAVVDHLDSLSEPARSLAAGFFFARRPIRELVVKHRINRRTIERHLDFIRGWARALRSTEQVIPTHRVEFV